MNRDQFLRRLEELLSGISEEERIDAIAFYRSYFEDAGEENEAKVIEELGSPEKVAESIIGGPVPWEKSTAGSEGYSAYQYGNATDCAATYENDAQLEKGMKHGTGFIVMAVIIAILTCPIWIGILLGIIGVIIGIIAAAFGILAAIAAVTVAVWFVGFILIASGITSLLSMTAVGAGLIAAGFIILAIAILIVLGDIWIFGRFVPWAVRGIAGLFKSIFHRTK